jgi:integrase
MQVRRLQSGPNHTPSFELLGDDEQPIPVVTGFLRHLSARGYSPNTLSAYAYDLLHFFRFLSRQNLTWEDFTPALSLAFLEYLRQVSSHKRVQRLGLTLCAPDTQPPATHLSSATINRILAAVSSFYEYLILSAHWQKTENPILKEFDHESIRVRDRHRPALGGASRQQPVRRVIRVRTVQRVPRPLTDEQVTQLFNSFHSLRDKAIFLLMLHGGLRPGEVLNLRLEDIQYGRRRIIVRCADDHPKGARTKSRVERLVDLHDPDTLQTLSAYVMHERPWSPDNTFVFLVGGKGTRRNEPLSYSALVKIFQRHCQQLNIRAPWITPHALRHTHATQMWEGGMRELSLQKRLGHASPESTRLYTRVSDATVVAEYLQALGGKEKKQ